MQKDTIEFQWKKDYETGVNRIDFEHKVFLDLINSFNIALKNGIGHDDAVRIVIEIEKYAEFHFISEENLMRFIKFPGFKEHQIEHFDLIENLNIAKHNNCDLTSFIQFLKKWFVNHTINEDIKIKEWIEKEKIDVSAFNYNITI